MKNRVYLFLSEHPQVNFNFVEIARALKIKHQDNYLLTRVLKELSWEGKIVFKSNTYQFLAKSFATTGTFKMVNKNFGFIHEQDATASYYVSKENFNNSFDQDLVAADVYLDRQNERYYAIVTKVISTQPKFLIGTIVFFNGQKRFQAYEKKYQAYKYYWKDRFALNNYRAHDIVKTKIEKIDNDKVTLSIIKKIGEAQDPLAPLAIILDNFAIQQNWDLKLKPEILKIPQTIDNKEINKRRDLRQTLIFTIDGKDTKDFDDAITVKKRSDHYLLGVYIADVSHYVRPQTLLDAEALKRGTSIYLPDRVIPMLPETLSNGICSLNPGLDRLVLALEMKIDFSGKVLEHELFEAVINSHYRLLYQEVNLFWDQKYCFLDAALVTLLKEAQTLSELIQNQKNAAGYVDFEIEESKVVLDAKGYTQAIEIEKRGNSEIMIENFMVSANETVAQAFVKKALPSIFRVHEAPPRENLENLNNVFQVLDLPLKVSFSKEPKAFAQIVKKLKTLERFDNFSKIMLLRTLPKALYGEQNLGHFGLAAKAYSHFTSPIRRYPDLLLHRLVKDLLLKDADLETLASYREQIQEIAQQSSLAEQNAVSIERKINDIKKAEYYQKYLNEVFKVQIVSILRFGIFVEFKDKTSAMIHLKNIFHDQFQADEKALTLKGKQLSYKLGDWIEARIVTIDWKRGKIDAIFAKDYDAYRASLFNQGAFRS